MLKIRHTPNTKLMCAFRNRYYKVILKDVSNGMAKSYENWGDYKRKPSISTTNPFKQAHWPTVVKTEVPVDAFLSKAVVII